LAHYVSVAASLHHRATKVLNWVAQKALKLLIERTCPLAEVAQAQRDLESRKTTGKLVVEIG
jgi:NADPH2:quinone reductase